jgi:hypothetical protein
VTACFRRSDFAIYGVDSPPQILLLKHPPISILLRLLSILLRLLTMLPKETVTYSLSAAAAGCMSRGTAFAHRPKAMSARMALVVRSISMVCFPPCRVGNIYVARAAGQGAAQDGSSATHLRVRAKSARIVARLRAFLRPTNSNQDRPVTHVYTNTWTRCIAIRLGALMTAVTALVCTADPAAVVPSLRRLLHELTADAVQQSAALRA